MQKILEICCYTVESAIKAEKAGANRVELCDNYPEGGTTPSYGAIQQALKQLSIPVNVIVRPRGGDFHYSHEEFEVIKADVGQLKKMGVNGIVVGFLHANGTVDIARTKEIVELAAPMEVTFHRAFDMCNNPLKALGQLKTTGISRILTSGAQQTALQGMGLLKQLTEAAGETLSIMPGSGVNEQNLQQLMEITGAHEFHSSAKTFRTTNMTWFNPHISMGGDNTMDEYKTITVDADQIKAMAKILHKQHE